MPGPPVSSSGDKFRRRTAGGAHQPGYIRPAPAQGDERADSSTDGTIGVSESGGETPLRNAEGGADFVFPRRSV